jgi:parallel beta-helix repeat protein
MNRSAFVLPLSLILIAGAVAAAGPLDPPVGPVQPSMKPLSQVEPRMPLSAVNTPGDQNSTFRITAAGSYYLADNLVGEAGKAGIEIAASGVSVDLMGFTLQGATGTLEGVTTDGPQLDLAVRNGFVSGWGRDGVNLIIAGDLSGACLVENVHATLNSGNGISAGIGSIVRSCIATSNRETGILVDGGSVVESCLARHNAVGIRVGDHSNVRASQGVGNFGIGIFLGPECTVSDSAAQGNTDTGIYSQGSGTILNCTATANFADGVLLYDSVVRGCSVRGNFREGINAIGKCVVEENTSEDNVAGMGIRLFGEGARVRGNQVSGNVIGINVAGKNNLIISNIASLNEEANYEIEVSNRVGTVVHVAKSDAISGSRGGAGLGTTDPWANLAY